MSDYTRVVTNEDGEPIGTETIYDDPQDQEDWYSDDY